MVDKNYLLLLRNIEIKRSGEKIGIFDFYDLLIKGNTKSDIKLQSNDAIVINPTLKTVKISGEVKIPSRFELKKEEKFSDLINFA